jgi:hypothetical protein
LFTGRSFKNQALLSADPAQALVSKRLRPGVRFFDPPLPRAIDGGM